MSPYGRLLKYVSKYRREFLLGLACAVLNKSVALAGPLVLSYAVDDLTRAVTRTKLFGYGALLLAIAARLS